MSNPFSHSELSDWAVAMFEVAQQHWPNLTWEQFAAAGQAVTGDQQAMSLNDVGVALQNKVIEMYGPPDIPFES